MLYGIPSDDQPFVNGMNSDKTFFSRDDCEGRLQQGLLVKQSLESLARLSPAKVKMIMQKENHPILRDLDENILNGLILAAKTIAWMFENGIMTFHMIVGEACFKSYPQNTSLKQKHLSGHSFGAVIINPNIQPETPFPIDDSTWDTNELEEGMHIIEATGWMDEYIDSRERVVSNQYARMFALSNLPPEMMPSMRSCTTPDQCDSLYCFVYMIDEYIAFGFDPSTKRWLYGATPSQILKGSIQLLKPDQIVSGLDDYCKTKNASAANPVVQQVASDLPPHTLARMMRDVGEVGRMLDEVEELCDSLVPYIHPPPDEHRALLRKLKTWYPITTEHVPTKHQQTIAAFSTPGRGQIVNIPESHYLQSHPFLCSTMHLVKERKGLS